MSNGSNGVGPLNGYGDGRLTEYSNGPSFDPGNTHWAGMHRFQTAGQLQQCLEQIGGPGADVNITHAYHGRRSQGQGNSGILLNQGQSDLGPSGRRGSGAQELFQAGLSPGGHLITSSPKTPVQRGYQRHTYLVTCEIHPRPRSNEAPVTDPNTALRRISGVSEGNGRVEPLLGHVRAQCAICQRDFHAYQAFNNTSSRPRIDSEAGTGPSLHLDLD